jgi:inner membrane protein
VASPIGHALSGYAIGRIGGRGGAPGLWIGCAALAVAPDLDFVPGILVGQPALYHQDASHSLWVALAVSLLAALALCRGRHLLLRRWAIFFSAYASHLVIDLFGPDGRPPIGIPLFWPWSDAAYLFPVALLPGIQHAESTTTETAAWIASILSWYNVKAILIEMALVAPLLLLGELRQRLGRPGGPSRLPTGDRPD